MMGSVNCMRRYDFSLLIMTQSTLYVDSLNWLNWSLSGIKFIVLADPRQSGIDALLRKIYEVYSDFALKNPFYSLEMPIR